MLVLTGLMLLLTLTRSSDAFSVTLPPEGSVPSVQWKNETWDSSFDLILDTSGCHHLKRDLVVGDWNLQYHAHNTDVQFYELQADNARCHIEHRDDAEERLIDNIRHNAEIGLREISPLLARPANDDEDSHDELRRLLSLTSNTRSTDLLAKIKWTLYMLPQLAVSATVLAVALEPDPNANSSQAISDFSWKVGYITAGAIIYSAIIARCEEMLKAKSDGDAARAPFWKPAERLAALVAVAWARSAVRKMRMQKVPQVEGVEGASLELLKEPPQTAVLEGVCTVPVLQAVAEEKC